jgi:rod shape-determining protein MreB
MNLFASFAPVLYIQISPDRLKIVDVKRGTEIDEPPLLAIVHQPEAKVVAFGSAAQSVSDPAAVIVNPFAHPRSLVSDFTVAEQLLKALVRRIRQGSFSLIQPMIVLHPLGSPDGGFTQVEIRAFHEMALGAGASRVIVREGRPLTQAELLARDYAAGGRLLS